MKQTPIFETKNEKGEVLKIFQDENYDDSSRSWDNLGTIIAWHRRYSLSDKDAPKIDSSGWKEWKEENPLAVCLPLFMLDHSGLAFSTTSFNDYWDSGQLGFIFVTKEKLIKEFGDCSDKNIKKATKILNGEIETLNQEHGGEVYYFTITRYKTCDCCKHTEEEIVDSCGGFIGKFEEVKKQILSDCLWKIEVMK